MSNPESALSSPPDSAAALTAGQKLAGVYVLKQQASGSDTGAAIWLAQDEVLGKDVSLHFIPPAVRTDGRAMTELRQEIKRNRQLIHPNILRVYDLIEEPDWAAISMDAFEGESVAALQRNKEGGFFEPGDVKAWFQQLCLALEDVHKVNLLHRNVSPPNLVLDKSGKLLLTNFGISRVIEDALGRARKEGPDRHLAFLSPQQLDGEPATRADDVYSLGATLYEVLTGEAPFVEGELVSQIRKVTPQSMMERRAKLGKKGGTILPTWEKAVASCLAKAPNERPPTAADLASKLGLSGKSAPAAEPPAGAAAAAPTNVVPMRPEPQKKMPPVKTVSPARKEPPAPAVPAASAASSSSLKSYSEIAAAVEADEREEARREQETGAGKNAPGRPPGGSPQKSNGPMIAAAAGILIAAVCGYLWWSSGQNSTQTADNPPSQKSQSTADVSPGQPDSSTDHEQASPPPPDQQPLVGSEEAKSKAPVNGAGSDQRTGAETPSASGASETASTSSGGNSSGSNASGSTPSGGNSSGGNSSGGSASNANPLPAKSTASGSAPAATPIAEPPPSIPQDGPLLAESKRTKKGEKSTDTAPATPVPAAASSLPAKGGDAPLTLAEAQRSADTAAKKAQEAHKQQQEADAAASEAQKSLDQKSKSAAPLVEAAKELQSQRQEKEEAMKAADLAAQQARQAAEEKNKLAEESKKALSDWVSKNGSKLTARDNANAEVQLLQKTLADKQSAAASAAKAAADAEAANEHAAAVLKKAQEAESARVAEAAAKKAAEEKAAKRAQLDDELQKVDQMRKDLEEKMKKLEDLKKEIDTPAASTPASQSDLGSKPSPAPIASATTPKRLSAPPAPPPPPKPVVPPPSSAPVETALDAASNSTQLALSTEPAPLPPPKSPPEGKTSSGQVVFENSLGM
ncbi:MAG TPA: protein kinase, partial [Chthoniobacteraceae bacterium]